VRTSDGEAGAAVHAILDLGAKHVQLGCLHRLILAEGQAAIQVLACPRLPSMTVVHICHGSASMGVIFIGHYSSQELVWPEWRARMGRRPHLYY